MWVSFKLENQIILTHQTSLNEYCIPTYTRKGTKNGWAGEVVPGGGERSITLSRFRTALVVEYSVEQYEILRWSFILDFVYLLPLPRVECTLGSGQLNNP